MLVTLTLKQSSHGEVGLYGGQYPDSFKHTADCDTTVQTHLCCSEGKGLLPKLDKFESELQTVII